jgi:hypothetical protein
MEFINFFFFGCWNLCDHLCNRDQVIQSIFNANKLKKFDFGILGGDNHYPNSITKKYKWTDFFDGFSKLDKLEIPIFGVLGNHDTSNKNKIKVQLNIHQIYYGIHLFHFHVQDHPNGKIRFIFINTSHIYEMKNPYKFYKFICKYCIDQSKINFIVGHHPIFGFEKIIGTENKTQYIHLPHFQKFCKLLHRKIRMCSNLKIFYLCSDIHNFQINKISSINNPKIFFLVIICGTGGGIPNHLDKCDLSDILFYKKICIQNLKKKNAFGFLSVQIFDEKKIKFIYKKVF